MNMLENKLPITNITVMIQKEVAYRMEAKPSTKNYGALSVIVQYFCKPYLVANVPRNCFMPRPNVDSAVISLTPLNKPPININNLDLFYYVVKVAFSQRRKTLLNCIFNAEKFKFNKQKITEILNEAEFNTSIRGECLTIQDFEKLTKIIEKYIS